MLDTFYDYKLCYLSNFKVITCEQGSVTEIVPRHIVCHTVLINELSIESVAKRTSISIQSSLKSIELHHYVMCAVEIEHDGINV